jgi:hypothetical protein
VEKLELMFQYSCARRHFAVIILYEVAFASRETHSFEWKFLDVPFRDVNSLLGRHCFNFRLLTFTNKTLLIFKLFCRLCINFKSNK